MHNEHDAVGQTGSAAWPPEGWVTREEAARRLGVSVATLGDRDWVRRLSFGVEGARRPKGRCKIYPAPEVERVRREREAERTAGPAIPEGFVDRAGACRILGITERAFKHWITDGKLTFGVHVGSRVGGRRAVYPVGRLNELRAELLGRDKLFKGGAGTFDVPAGWARRFEACQMFGVDKPTWQAWERDGHLPAGKRFDDGPVVYRVEDLKRMLARLNMLAPPCPADPADPDAAAGRGAIRVPLCGGSVRGAGGRVAIVDPETMPLLDGAVLSWESVNGGEVSYVGLCRPEKPRGVALRRVVMGVSDDGIQVGHANGDPLDCRRSNLIARTIQQRNFGMRKMKSVRGQPCTSRFKGVCLEKQTGRWRAQIQVDGHTHKLGRFRDEIAAAEAYDEAARELFGEHARLNFPDGVDAFVAAGHARDERSGDEDDTRAAA
jgi:predicted site-specific integrase-resolvase